MRPGSARRAWCGRSSPRSAARRGCWPARATTWRCRARSARSSRSRTRCPGWPELGRRRRRRRASCSTSCGRGGARICIVEDAHWADEATIDVLTFVARRVEATRALLVVSFRDDEVGPDHPLRRALAAAAGGSHAPARAAAPERRGGRAGWRERRSTPRPCARSRAATRSSSARRWRAARGGRRRACATRSSRAAARLSRRRTGGGRAGQRASRPCPAVAAGGVRGVRGSVPGCPKPSAAACSSSSTTWSGSVTSWRAGRSRSRWPDRGAGTSTARCCACWSAATRLPARLAHHAWAAGDADAIVRHGLAAAHDAVAAHSHREAEALLIRVLEYGHLLAVRDRAAALELLSEEAYYGNQPVRAVSARRAGAGAPARARRAAADRRDAALAVAHPVGRGRRRRRRARRRGGGRAAGAVSREPRAGAGAEQPLAARHARPARRRRAALGPAGDGARAPARRHGDPRPRPDERRRGARAQRTRRGARAARGGGAAGDRRRARRARGARAVQRGLDAQGRPAVRARARAAGARPGLRARARDRHLRRVPGRDARADRPGDGRLGRRRRGRGRAWWRNPGWRTRWRASRRSRSSGSSRVRRGQPGAREHLDEAWELARATGELQRLRPIACARAEAAWLAGRRRARSTPRRATCSPSRCEVGHEWDVGELLLWRFRAGLQAAVPEPCPLPIARELAGDARGAARPGPRSASRTPQAVALLGAQRPRAAARRHRAARPARRDRRGRPRARPAAPRGRHRRPARAAAARRARTRPA